MSAEIAHYLPGAMGLLYPLQHFIEDAEVSEILINKPGEVFIEKNGTLKRYEIPALSSKYLRRLFTLIANENKLKLNESSPILSGSLENGARIQLVIPPASCYETLSIRQFTVKRMGFEDYARDGFFLSANKLSGASSIVEQELKSLYDERNWQSFITQAILHKKNILISGGTSSGKTTFLNSCIEKIGQEERIITLEDTYEINVTHPNVVRLKAPKVVGEQVPLVTMQDLVQAALRLRPDRIIMGEIRGREVFDFVSACTTGHSGSLATIHANNPKVAFMRMTQLYKLNNVADMSEKDIYDILHEVIDVILQVEKTSHGRRLREVYYKHVH